MCRRESVYCVDGSPAVVCQQFNDNSAPSFYLHSLFSILLFLSSFRQVCDWQETTINAWSLIYRVATRLEKPIEKFGRVQRKVETNVFLRVVHYDV